MSRADELLKQLQSAQTFQERISALQDLGKVLEPTDTEAIDIVQQISSYKLYTGLAPYATKVLQYLQKKHPEFTVGSGSRSPKVREELKNLQSDDFRERLRVLEYFECEGVTEAAPHLLNLLKTEDHPWVVSKLTKTTGLLGAPHDNEHILDCLLPFLSHEDDRIRANTIEGIGGLQSNRKLPILLDMMLKDDSERVKQMAAIAISFDDTVKALDLLRVMLDGDDMEQAEAALKVVKRFDWVEASNMYEDYREIIYQRKESAAFEASLQGMDTDSSMRALGDRVLEDFDFDLEDEEEPAKSAEKDVIDLDNFMEEVPEIDEESDFDEICLEPSSPVKETRATVETLDSSAVTIDEPEPEISQTISTDGSAPEKARARVEDQEKVAQVQEPAQSASSVDFDDDSTEVAQMARSLGLEVPQSKTQEASKPPKDPPSRSVKSSERYQISAGPDPATQKMLQVILKHVKEVESKAQERAIELAERRAYEEELRELKEEQEETFFTRLRTVAVTVGMCALVILYVNVQDSFIAWTYKMVQAYKNLDESGNKRVQIVVRDNQPTRSAPQDINALDYFAPEDVEEMFQDAQNPAVNVAVQESSPQQENPPASGSSVAASEKTTQAQQIAKTDVLAESTNASTEKTEPATAKEEVTEPVVVVQKTEPVESEAQEPEVETSIDQGEDEHLSSRAQKLASKPGGKGAVRVLSKPPRDGVNKYIYPNGDRYAGNFLNHKRHGEGTMFFHTGEIYVGGWNEDKFHGYGTYTWPSGDRYIGDWRDGMRHGEGVFKWINGEEYRGAFANGNRHGFGEMKFANSETYRGDWYEDLFHGPGTYVFSNGAKYDGEFNHGIIHGKGTFRYSNGREYSGDFVQAMRQGDGEMVFPNGEKYSGGWKEDVYHGKGSYEWPNGESYRGDFQEGKMEGEGEHSWSNGDRYVGQFENDHPHGKGVMFYANEARYEGSFAKGLRHGDGVYIASNGYTYMGSWAEGKRNGMGTTRWPDGEGYSGEWLNDEPHGVGRYVWPSGHKYVGQWSKGDKHGLGTFIWRDGQIQEGVWNAGQFVGKKVQNERLSRLEKKLFLMVSEEMGQEPMNAQAEDFGANETKAQPKDPASTLEQAAHSKTGPVPLPGQRKSSTVSTTANPIEDLSAEEKPLSSQSSYSRSTR